MLKQHWHRAVEHVSLIDSEFVTCKKDVQILVRIIELGMWVYYNQNSSRGSRCQLKSFLTEISPDVVVLPVKDKGICIL